MATHIPASALAKRRENLAAGLYIVATPIGHARDITLRALDVLAAADKIFCEDTRVSKKLFALYGLAAGKLSAYHEHNGARVRPKILQAIKKGAAVALISDAGTPLISDPGYRLVQACHKEGCAVFAVPGASAPIAALSIAGLPSDKFMFVGFCGAKKSQRQKALENVRPIAATLILFESARRLKNLLADIDAVLGAREITVCRELTKKFEELKHGTPSALLDFYETNPPKGEIVVLIAPPETGAEAWDKAAVRAGLEAALAQMGVRDAAAQVAKESGWARRDVYQLGLALKKEEEKNEPK